MYSVDANNDVWKDGVKIARDIQSIDYRDFLYWQAHGVELAKTLDLQPEPVEDVPVVMKKEDKPEKD